MFGWGRAGDGATDQGGIAFDGDVITTATRRYTALAGGALVVVGDGGVAFAYAAANGVAHAEREHADAQGNARAVLFAVKLAGVLQGDDVEVATDVGLDGVAGQLCAHQVGVATALDGELVGGGDQGVVVGGLRAIGVGIALGCTELQADAVLLAKANGHACTHAVRFVRVFDAAGVDCGHQVDVFGGVQADVLALQLGGGGGDVTAGGGDLDVFGLDVGALDRGAGTAAVLLGGAAAYREADAHGCATGVPLGACGGVGHASQELLGSAILHKLVRVIPGFKGRSTFEAVVGRVFGGLQGVGDGGDLAAYGASQRSAHGEAAGLKVVAAGAGVGDGLQVHIFSHQTNLVFG